MNNFIVVDKKNLVHRYTHEYVGRAISLNDFYSQKHWSNRFNIKKKYKTIFRTEAIKAIQQIEAPLSAYVLMVYYNSKHDPDNVVGMEKIFADAIKADDNFKGLIIDDSKRYCKGVALLPDPSLKMNTFKFVLYEVVNNDDTKRVTKRRRTKANTRKTK